MKITLDTPDRLVLDDHPVLMGIMLAGVILLVAGIGVAMLAAGDIGAGLMMVAGTAAFGLPFALFIRRTIAIFDRQAGAVVIRERSMFGQKERSLPLADIRRVLLQSRLSTSKHQRRRTRVSRVALGLAGAQTLPLMEAYQGGDGAARAAEAAARWLGVPGPA